MAVTLHDVESAYRFLLGREPDADEVNIWLRIDSTADLRKAFLSSEEFKAKIRSDIPGLYLRDEAHVIEPQMIDCEVDEHRYTMLVERVAKTWTNLGETEPHWSVLSADVFKSVNIENVRSEFFASGLNDVKRILAILARHNEFSSNFGRLVEFGCGVGRVTAHLSDYFSNITGIDISQSHLNLAQETVTQSSKKNVDLLRATMPDFGMVVPFDLWFSHIVLQHNPPPIIAAILRKMFAMLNLGGLAIFQAPSYCPGYRFVTEEYLNSSSVLGIEVHCISQSYVFKIADEAGCVPLEVLSDEAMPSPWLSNTYVFRKIRSSQPTNNQD